MEDETALPRARRRWLGEPLPRGPIDLAEDTGNRDLQGEFGGVKDAYVGVPVLLGAGGIRKVYDIPVSADELKAIQAAGYAVKELVAATPKG